MIRDELSGKRRRSDATGESSVECVPPRPKRARVANSEEFKTNQCSACFHTYEDDESGSDWVECVCGRWIHDDCIEECIVDSNGKERMCPICLAV